MSLPCILLSLALAKVSANDNVLSNHELKSLVRSSVDELCPLSNVCHNEASDPIDFRENKRPCCTSCSCKDDCHLNGNCCFINGTIRDVRARQQCLTPATRSTGKVYRPYRFITECPTSADQVNEPETHLPCGEQPVAPWGSLYPVYSKTSRLLYKNSKCAECHGVTDGLLWVPELQCHSSEKTVSDAFKCESIGGSCRVVFNYPGDRNDIQNLQCFPSVVQTCGHNGVYTVGNIEQEKITRICESDFFAPFITTLKVYANVYCYLCNSDFPKPTLFCPIDPIDGRINAKPLVSLLGRDFILEMKDGTDDLREAPIACLKDAGNNCRTLFCPNGQFRTKNGDCKQIAESWDVEYITFVVKIAPETHVDLVTVESFFEHRLSLNSIHKNDAVDPYKTQKNTFVITENGGLLQMPLTASCEVERIYIDSPVNDRSVSHKSHFVAKLRLRPNVTNPSKILHILSAWLGETWAIQIDNITTIAYQTLYQYEFPFNGSPDHPCLEKPLYTALINSSDTNVMNIHTPALQLFHKWDPLDHKAKIWYINNKLSLCNHVRLHSDEYILFIDDNLLYLKRQARILYNSEFLILNDDGEKYVHACVDDMNMAISGCLDIKVLSTYIVDLVFGYGLFSVSVFILIHT